MSDPRFPVECFACGDPIETADELAIATSTWFDDDPEFNLPCHRECLADEEKTAE